MKRISEILKRKEFIFKNRKEYRYWKYKKNGMKTVDATRGPGYYLNIAYFNHSDKGMKWESPMKSGKTGIYELIDYRRYSDPYDMVESSRWNFIGYKDEKPITECTFDEFMEIYIKRH
nr:hypothetical protein [uncultured Prevotella sp.]